MIRNYDIGLAVAEDALRIAELSRDAIEHGLGWSWTPARVARSLRDRSTNVIVARDGGEMAGFALMKYGDDEAHLLLLAVHAAHRRCGVARALLGWLEATVRVAGITTIRLETRTRNAAARAFYLRHGFTEIDVARGYYSGVEDSVRMVKQIGRMAAL